MITGITIGQLAAFAGVTIKAVRHDHQRGLLKEPPRDISGYRCCGAVHAIELVKSKRLLQPALPERVSDETNGEIHGVCLRHATPAFVVLGQRPPRARLWH
jgi:hypothetical protein